MELALTLVSIASFFGLIVAWAVLPATDRAEQHAPSTAAAQTAS